MKALCKLNNYSNVTYYDVRDYKQMVSYGKASVFSDAMVIPMKHMQSKTKSRAKCNKGVRDMA